MTDWHFFALQDGEATLLASWDAAEQNAAIRRYFDMKRAEGGAQQAADTVLALLLDAPVVVARGRFGLVKRALRHYDEIGHCAELVDLIDEAKDNGAEAVGWGADAATLATVTPYDFGDLQV